MQTDKIKDASPLDNAWRTDELYAKSRDMKYMYAIVDDEIRIRYVIYSTCKTIIQES
jgi:hypothetical protein